MSSVVSKNLYELLGNDPELDPDRAPEPPTKVIDKPVARTGKRNGGAEPAPKEPTTARPARRQDGVTGNEQAFRDRTAGSQNNRTKPTEDGARPERRPREGGERSRGSRGGRGGRGGRGPRDDRHDRSGVAAPTTQDKQGAHGWGANTGDAEFADEKAGLADAREEEKEGVVADSTPVDAEGNPIDQEAEDKTKSYEQYLAEQLEKKAALAGAALPPRQANEGSSKKFPEGKPIVRSETEEAFIAGSGGKAKRERERKAKQTIDIDQAWKEPAAPAEQRGGFRGGRGGPRGAGRGGRGDRGDRAPRGDRADRGDRAPRGNEQRGGKTRGGPSPNLGSASDFPSLGA